MNEKLEAAERFIEVWGHSGLASSLIDDYECTLTCNEAEAYAGLFRAFGHEGIADMIIADHTQYDEPGDDHYQEENQS